ncbi:SDR family NAD(P)-dependent oxidoreductase [Ideonella sp. A 288]|uniref:SDR family NAD(P)-dependent oxidoreductase n=1 Tax=Ideonella sp. A 288 TaxID=1962181 RepID=UPI001F29DE4B|nr:SDR family NAD(P)-dependent oxidoreductase [Ideonella sp. A 288]
MNTHLTIVTGSSRGVGAALVAELLQPGHAVLGLARQRNDALQARAEAAGASLTQWQVDLAEPGPVAERLIAWLSGQAPAGLASVTLINNAGVVSTPAPLGRAPLAELSTALRVGLEAALLLTAAFLQATDGWTMPRRVLNVSSGLGRRAMAGSAAYCAAKAGMDHFTRAVALEQAARPHGARVVSMAPGVIDTDMQVQLRSADAALFPERERFAKLQADGLLLSPQACAQMLLARLARADFGDEPVADIRDAA